MTRYAKKRKYGYYMVYIIYQKEIDNVKKRKNYIDIDIKKKYCNFLYIYFSYMNRMETKQNTIKLC